MAVVDSCHMPQAISTFPQCVMSSVLKDEVFHVAFPRLIPAGIFPEITFGSPWSKVANGLRELADDDSSSATTDNMHHQHESQPSLEIYPL